MDFITNLPESEVCTNLIVVTERLSKVVVLIALPNLDIETVCHRIVRDTSPPELGSGHLCTAALGPGVNAALTRISLLARRTNSLARSGTFWFRTPLFV